MILTITFIFIFGLVIGSFISALTWRLPRGINMISDRSRCDNCNSQIFWFDNIPVFSYLILGGKCRNCKKHVSIRYPLIELATAVIFVFMYLAYSTGQYFPDIGYWTLPYLLLISAVMIAIFVIDFEYQIIPDELVFLLFGLNLIIFPLLLRELMYEHLLAGFLASLFLLLLNIFTKGRGMGLGDVKLALFAGSFLGIKNSISWLFLSFIVGALIGVLLIFLGKASFGRKIAFGPFLVISFFMVLFWGEQISRLLVPYF